MHFQRSSFRRLAQGGRRDSGRQLDLIKGPSEPEDFDLRACIAAARKAGWLCGCEYSQVNLAECKHCGFMVDCCITCGGLMGHLTLKTGRSSRGRVDLQACIDAAARAGRLCATYPDSHPSQVVIGNCGRCGCFAGFCSYCGGLMDHDNGTEDYYDDLN